MWVGIAMLVVAPWLANRRVIWATFFLTVPHVLQVVPLYAPTQWLTATKTPAIPAVSEGKVAATAVSSSSNSTGSTSHEAGRPLKIVSFNVFIGNRDFQTTIDYLRQCDADLIGIIECTPAWESAIREGIKDLYPYDTRDIMPGWSGNHIWSRIPITPGYKDEHFGQIAGANKLMAVKAQWAGQPFIYAAVHPASPDRFEALKLRNQEFDLISSVAQSNAAGRNYPIVFAGDFNCTSGSAFFTELIESSGLVDTRKGFGLQASWPTYAPPILIPIDHVLVSDQWKTRYREIGPNLGSDHLPVYIELDLPKTSPVE